ncbi:MAG: amino acid adenylation domain-containing protein [Arcicella sp.]|jgi:amino acid adenylation domain-containing protein/non-ribosomal peptide synthase protein (TIGR01720 family)|nr:amino acid adenylation domain-containing protein [Arcicella sp.]
MENIFSTKNIKDIYQLSPMQEGIYFHGLMDESSTTYCEQMNYKLRGKLNTSLLEKALRMLVQRHDVLRTIFNHKKADVPLQVVLKDRDISLYFEDLRNLNTDEIQQKFLQDFKKSNQQIAFDLTKDVLFRVSVFQLEDEIFEIIWTYHHIILDGWCVSILLEEFLEIYNSLLENRPLRLASSKPFRNYIKWLGELNQEDMRKHWEVCLEEYDTVANLNGGVYNFDATTVDRTEEILKTLSKEKTTQIRTFATHNRMTVNSILQSLWGVVLAKNNQREDVIFGTVVSGRPPEMAGIENMIGLFVNTIPTRIRFGNTTTLLQLLQTTQQNYLSDIPHQYYPLSKIQAISTLKNNLIDHVFVYENFPISERLKQLSATNDVEERLEIIEAKSHDVGKFNFNFVVYEEDELRLSLQFNPAVYSEIFIEKISHQFIQLIDILMADANTVISKISLISESEKLHQLQLNDTFKSYIPNSTIHQYFRNQAKNTPNSIAIINDESFYTYAQLDALSSHFASILVNKYQINVGEKVAVYMPRSTESIICLLAILKIGGIYVPINADAPFERVSHVLGDCSAKAIITHRKENYPINLSLIQIGVEEIVTNSESNETELYTFENTVVKPSDNAYIIYTSGSTGKPKGVPIRHESLLSRILYHTHYIGIKEEDTILQFASHSFDASLVEIFMAFLSGGKIVIASDEQKENITSLIQLIDKYQVSVAIIPPAYLKILNKNPLPSIRKIISTGEAATIEEMLFYAATKDCYNGYGPTETCVGASFHKIDLSLTDFYRKQKSIPIGKPFADTKIYILDQYANLIPTGMKGEICVSGIGLSDGYLNDVSLSDKKFIKNPYQTDSTDGRLYFTGDLGYWNESGELIYCGRKDNQVQVRGIRVELGEIENIIQSFPNVKNVVVLPKKNADETTILVAYVEVENMPSQNEWRNFLRNYLPEYMFPTFFVEITQWDLTKTGKIDRKKLALKDIDITNEKAFQAPQNEKQRKIVEIWQEVIGKEKISIYDNFFEIGGDSIKAIQIVSRLYRLQFKAEVKDLFQFPTVEEFAEKLIDLNENISQSAIVGTIPLTPIQKEFFLTEIENKNFYNQSVMLKSEKRILKEDVKYVFLRLTTHHDALRMSYLRKSEEYIQVNNDVWADFEVDEYDFQNDENPHESLTNRANSIQSSLNLSKSPLIKVTLFRLPDADRLLIIVHHLVIDGVSWRILLEDLDSLFQQISNKEPLLLPLKTDSFSKWATELTKYANSEKFLLEKEYWKTIENCQVEALPKSNHQQNDFPKLKTVHISLEETQTKNLLQKVHHAFGTEINDILLTTLGLASKKVFGHNNTLLTLEGHGRENILADINISRTIGWFTTTFPVIINSQWSDNFAKQIMENKEMLRQIPNKGIGYGILKYLTDSCHKEDINFKSTPQIVFNYLGQFDSDIPKSVFSIAQENAGETHDSDDTPLHQLSVLGAVMNHKLDLSFNYDSAYFSEKTIESLANNYHQILLELIDFCVQKKDKSLTISDLTHKKISSENLEKLSLKYDLQDVYHLTPMQEGMLFNALLDKKSEAYSTQVSYRFLGECDAFITECSLNELFIRYEILRTVFDYETTDDLLQIVLKKQRVDFSFYDISDLSEIEKEEYIQTYKLKDRAKGFNLSSDVLMRISVLQLNKQEYEFIWCNHHILMDGWCAGILIAEFSEIYSRLLEGKKNNLSPITPFKIYTKWLESVDKKATLQFWDNYLLDYEEAVSIPKRNIPAAREYKREKVNYLFSHTQTKQLNNLAQQHKVSLNTVIQSLWGILLAKFNDTNDLVFGTVVSGRPPSIVGIESMVGLFINTIPVRIKIETELSFEALIQQVHHNNITSEPHHFCSLAHIQANTYLKQSLLDHILVFESYPLADKLAGVGKKNNGNSWQITKVETIEQSSFDFEVIINPGEELNVTFVFNENIYDIFLIKKVMDAFKMIVEQVLQNQQQLISQISIVSPEEEHKLLNLLNDTSKEYDVKQTLVSMFEAQVAKNPERIALIGENRQLSYAELNELSNQLSNYLISKGLCSGEFVGVFLDRSMEMVISLLAILKIGGAYIPIDTEYPTDRIAYILHDSETRFVLTSSSCQKNLPSDFSGEKILIDILAESIGQESSENPSIQVSPKDIAYIIYTSGSTGNPKGVMVAHEGIVNRINWQWENYKFSAEDVILQKTTYCFDVSVWEFFMTLCLGAKLVICPIEAVFNALILSKLILRHSVTTIHFVPSMYNAFLNSITENDIINLKSLRHILVSGEALSPSLVEKHYETVDIPLHNLYGPTEASVDVSYHHVTIEDAKNNIIPIGKPIANMQLLVLDSTLKLVPQGVLGEIYIGGIGLACGYLNQPALTEKNFIMNPYRSGERLYRTGDLGRWLPSGELEYVGRTDFQVKLRGYRIELKEIEQVLERHSEISQSIVLMSSSQESSNKFLIAYLKTASDLTNTQVREFLKESLPEYMIPSYFICMRDFPINKNGKLDRKLLPKITQNEVGFETPQNDLENQLVEIWAKTLNISKVGRNDNFFEVGGDSIIAIQIVSKLYRLGYKVEVIDIFNFPTIASLAIQITENADEIFKEETVEENTDFYEEISADDLDVIFNN